jgi:DNA-binding NarL/FixJ family response regulator
MTHVERWIFTGILLLMAGLVAMDVVSDLAAGSRPSHITVELLVVALSLLGVGYLWLAFFRLRESHASLQSEFETARTEARQWREKHSGVISGLGSAIDKQFEAWKLTNSEKEVGLLLLKGLGFKEIADLRGTSERTVRQQANVLYGKAGLAGRAELSAFFLEDLMLPTKI